MKELNQLLPAWQKNPMQVGSQYKAVLLMMIFVIEVFTATAQTRKYPADITPTLAPPYSVFLSDYINTSTNNNLLSAGIVFNDFNEASWTFGLKIKIESSKVRLQTVNGYRPANPITLPPGVLQTLTAADFQPYLSYENLDIAGININELIATGGRLPEGLYSFCFQVIDFATGDPLSAEVCRTAWLKLLDPPRLNLPVCDATLDPTITQNNFSWQLFDAPSLNVFSPPSYQLTVWELTEPTANVQNAVTNGQALQIFQSALLQTPTYAYGLSDPPLEVGKQYVYRVQVLDPEGRDRYKNQGYSEFCRFYFGWPTGGTIQLQHPPEGGGFRRKDIPYVRWLPVSTQLPGQKVSYQIRIVQMNDGQEKHDALNSNTSWYSYITPPVFYNYMRTQVLDKELEATKKYAWQVKAFTDQQEVGASDVSYFNGPSLMENFFAGIHRVAVDVLDGTNLDDISGYGRIRFKPEANAWSPIKFEHIQLKNNGEFYVMTGGEIVYDPGALSLELYADHEQNGKAYFDVENFRVNKDGIFAEGKFRWPLPFASTSAQVSSVISEPIVANYNNFRINTAIRLSDKNQFALLEPFNYQLALDKSSLIYIYNDFYRFQFNGAVIASDLIASAMPGKVTFPFDSLTQLFYNEIDASHAPPSIAPIARSSVAFVAKRFVIDLSDERSPDGSSSPSWKGISCTSFDLDIAPSFDQKGQFQLRRKHIQSLQGAPDKRVLLSSMGLDVQFNYELPDDSVKMFFQTFPAHLKHLKLTIDKNQVKSESSFIKGVFLIPVISTERKFNFTVLANNLGFQDGYLDDLENSQFTFNPNSGDQEIRITVKRAVLMGFERIAMTLDVDWPSLNLKLPNQRGFNVWGDYQIGFDAKNGSIPLSERVNTKLSNYAITLNAIGAGSSDGRYAFAIAADGVLGDDVSGSDGAPALNIYSSVVNRYVPASASGGIVAPSSGQIPFTAAAASVNQDFKDLQNNLEQKINDRQQGLITAQTIKDRFKRDPDSGVGGIANIEIEEDAPVADNIPVEGTFNDEQRSILQDIAAGFVGELSKPVTKPITDKAKELNDWVGKKVDTLVDSTSVFLDEQVKTIVNAIVVAISSKVNNDKVDVAGALASIEVQITTTLSERLKSSLRQAANNNIKIPVSDLITTQVSNRITRFIQLKGTAIVYTVITTGTGEIDALADDLLTDIPKVLDSIGSDVIAFVSPKNIRTQIEGFGIDFIAGLDIDAIGKEIGDAALKATADLIAKELGQAASKLAEQYASDLNLSGFSAGLGNPIGFGEMALRFKEGGIKGVFSIDPVPVRLETPVLSLNGHIKYTPQHPIYGDTWLGDIDVGFKVPKKFSFNAIYFNGKKDDIHYWFCQITPPDDNSEPYQLGKPLSKKARQLKEPVNMGMVNMVGASGRLYHHMREVPNNGIVPDATMRYGAYLHFVFYDKKTDGKNIRLEVSGEINSAENGDFTVAFDGNMQSQSPSPRVLTIDEAAAIKGRIMIRYNSAEEHFLGYAEVSVNKPNVLCAQGSLLVDVKPGQWRVAIGSREQRIQFVPGCTGWSPTGWLDINESEAEIGLGLQYNAYAEPGFDIGVFAVKIVIDAGIAAGIQAKVQYQPSFQLMQAGLWVDLWCNLGGCYKKALGDWNCMTLVQIYIRGDMLVIFQPPPTVVDGTLRGSVKIIGFTINFDAHVRKEL